MKFYLCESSTIISLFPAVIFVVQQHWHLHKSSIDSSSLFFLSMNECTQVARTSSFGVRSATIGGSPRAIVAQSWALSVFLNFFNNKKRCVCIFFKLMIYFCTSPI